jgi:serine/threonine-protein kinase HipA
MAEPNLLRLRFLGGPMGTLAYRPDGPFYALELDREFRSLGHELSPLNLPLDSFSGGPRVFRSGDSPFDGGLPGLIADSLPDAWGERMLKIEVPGLQTILGKLAAIGERGPGAITFEPVLGKGADDESVSTSLAGLARDADQLTKTPVMLTSADVNAALARGGSSLGGIRPKVSAHLPAAGDFQQLQNILIGGATPPGQVPCVVKLSPLDDEGGGAVEFAFWRMARNAGIRVPHASLVHDGERRHFASARFDRYLRPDGTWGRRHVHTLSGFLHRRASDGQIDYEDFIRSARTLGGAEEARECFRRAVFNLLTTNRDDHGRNHAFLYNETDRTWTLSPVYDLNPSVANVLIALTWLGSAEIPVRFEQVTKLAEIGGIPAHAARSIYDEVEAATFGGWRDAAAYAGVPTEIAGIWEKEMMQQTKLLREDAHRLVAPKKARPAGRKRSPHN